MKALKLILILVFLHLQGFAQVLLVDSLQNELARTGVSDSTRIDIYNELSFWWSTNDTDKGLLYADSAYMLSKKIKDERRAAASVNSRGINYWYKGADSLALESYHQVLEYHRSQGNLSGEGRMLNNMALLLYNKAEYREALNYHDQANKIFEVLNLRTNHINGLSNAGVVYLALADYPKALESFLKALSKTEEADINEKSKLNTNIGLVHKNLGNLKEAEKYQRTALQLYKRIGQKQGIASEMANLANSLQLMGRETEAEDLYLKALSLNREIGNERRIASDLANLGNYYKTIGDFTNAERYLEEAVFKFKDLEDILYLSNTYLDQADLWKIQKRPLIQVIDLQKKALEMAKKSQSLVRQQDAWKALGESYTAMGQYQQALEAYQNYMVYKDNIFNDENQKALTRMQIEYDFDLKAQQLASDFQVSAGLLEAKNEKQRIISIAALAFLSLFILAASLVFYYQRKKEKAVQQKLASDFQTQKVQLEYKALKAQMNPHFIFNALSSISNFLLKNESEKADYYLSRFALLIRKTLEFSDQELITFEEEIEMVETYIEIEALRLGKPIQLLIENETDISAQKMKIPPLLIQPMIENAIWHGIANSHENGKIEINLMKDGELLKLTVRDNGDPISIDTNNKSVYKKKSMGLSIIQGRLKILLGNENPQFHLEWKKLNQGSEVELHLPVLT